MSFSDCIKIKEAYFEHVGQYLPVNVKPFWMMHPEMLEKLSVNFLTKEYIGNRESNLLGYKIEQIPSFPLDRIILAVGVEFPEIKNEIQ